MATCQNCGYSNAKEGYNCPACGKNVTDPIAGILIAVVLLLIIGLIVGPAFLLFKAYKTATESKTNWWLIFGILAAIIALIISPYFNDKRGQWIWFSSTVFYVNLFVLAGASIMFFLRLKDKGFQIIQLFKTQNNEN